MTATRENNKASVCMFLPAYYPLPVGGAEIQAKRLAIELIQKGVNVFFLTPGRKGLPAEETIDGIKIIRFTTIAERLKKNTTSGIQKTDTRQKVKFDYSDQTGDDLLYTNRGASVKGLIVMVDYLLMSFLRLRKHRRSFSILQINTVTWMSVVIVALGKLMRKKVVIKDSTMDGVLQMYKAPFPNRSRNFISHNAYFVAMTTAIEQNMRKAGVAGEKIVRIPNGITASDNGSLENKSEHACLFVGNLYQQPAKGIDVLLQAWPLVLKEIPTARLIVIGDGNIAAYKEHVIKQGIGDSVEFKGKTDPVAYYKTSTLFVLPSRREGMSNALLEAMMYGLPVVATNISGSADLVEDGVNGYLVSPDDTKMLTEKIILTLKDLNLQEECKERNRSKVLQYCSFEKISDAYKQLYLKITNAETI